MKLAQINFKRALSVFLAVMLVVSSLVFAQVSSATTISEDENVFTDLEKTETVVLPFNTTYAENKKINSSTTRNMPGIVSATNGSYMYGRSDDGDGSGGIRWAKSVVSGGVMLACDNIISTSIDKAYKLSANTKYTVTAKVCDSSNDAVATFSFVGVSTKTSTEGRVYYSVPIKDTPKDWTTYTGEFTTDAELGDNIYLAFIILNPNGASISANLDEITITKEYVISTADVITFNDNGKVYYAYPDALTALPEGENGPLSSAFSGWVDADGNAVTEIPAAGTTVYAKYPVSTNIPDKVDSVYLSLFNTADKTLSGDDVKNTLGIVSSSGSSHEVYSRDITIADGSVKWVVKFTNSTNHSENLTYKSICFGRANVAGNGSKNAYILEPNTKYTVSYNVYHESGANISFDLAAASVTKASSGLVLDSNKPDSIIKAWTEYTRVFTTPDAETLGDNKYLLFVINNPALEKNTSWLYGVTITKTTAGTVADCITFTDGEDTFYAAPNALETLPEGANVPEGEEFLGWYDANGKKVTEVPIAGTVLTAKYGVEPKFIAASTRGESGSGATYKSAGVRFRSRIDVAEAGSATEIGFIAAPTAFLNGMTLPEYATSEGNDAISALVKADGMEEIVYAEITDENGKEYKDYQLVITGLTREGYEQNLLSTEISVAMYYIVDGVVNYTDTIAYSYDDVIAMRGN